MNEELRRGSVVKYKDGWMQVTAAFKNTVNLGTIFSGKTKYKKIPRSEVKEDHDAWYREWEKSDTYRSM